MAEIRYATREIKISKIEKHSKTLEEIKDKLDKMMAELKSMKRAVQGIAEELQDLQR